MIFAAIIIFTIAAMIGLYLLALVLQQKETPKAIALVHGLLAATALVLLIIYTVQTGADLLEAIILFVIAALGGSVLFARDIKGKPLPKWLAIAHGLLAVSGFIFLLIYAFNK
jgi:hypothetical protein